MTVFNWPAKKSLAISWVMALIFAFSFCKELAKEIKLFRVNIFDLIVIHPGRPVIRCFHDLNHLH